VLNRATVLIALLAIVIFVAGMLLAQREIISPRVGMLMFALGGIIGFVAVGLSITILFVNQAYPVAMIGLVGFLPFITVVGALADGLRFPMINDVTTDLEDVPAFIHAQTLPANEGRDMAYPEGFAEQVAQWYPELESRVFNVPFDQMFQRVIRYIEAPDNRMEVTYRDPDQGIIEGVATTRMFRFKDDFIVRLEKDGDRTRVDMRSKSRDGKSDLGANAKRIKRFLDSLPEEP
jgi:hypothetical protein